MENGIYDMFADFPDVLTVEQLRKALGIGRNKAYELVNTGLVKSVGVGRRILVPKCYVIDFICDVAEHTESHTEMNS